MMHELTLAIFGGAILAVVAAAVVHWIRIGYIPPPGETGWGWEIPRIYRRDDPLLFWATALLFVGVIVYFAHLLAKPFFSAGT